METVADIGEFGLIARLQRLVDAQGSRLAAGDLGIGDDAALLSLTPGRQLVVTCDAAVEGRHYLPDGEPRDVGWRAAAANLSDIAAMGAWPRYVLLSLGLRPEQSVAWLEAAYTGVFEALAPYAAVVAGGNVTMTPGPPFIDVTVMGEVEQGTAVRRSGARVGDALLLTGFPGQAAAGLRLCMAERYSAPAEPLVRAYTRPQPRVDEGTAARHCGVHAMLDTSDGLAGDLGQLCRASGVGARLEAELLPVSEPLRQACAAWGEDPLQYILSPSDDYELLLACAPQEAARVQQVLQAVRGTPVTRIGTMIAVQSGLCLVRQGRVEPLSGSGWDHFRA